MFQVLQKYCIVSAFLEWCKVTKIHLEKTVTHRMIAIEETNLEII